MKILVDLNRKYCITMLMVTHESKHRLLSNRVVRMADGKVLQVQTIPADERNLTYNQLKERVYKY